MDSLQDLDPDFETIFSSPHEHFRLLDLPPELLIRICELAVIRSGPLDITRARQAKQQEALVKPPAITRVCKLLRQEALPAFYRLNEFHAYHWGHVPCVRYWLKAIGWANLKSMGTLYFHAKFDPDFWMEKFVEMGVPTKIEVRKDQDHAKTEWGFWSMDVTFL